MNSNKQNAQNWFNISDVNDQLILRKDQKVISLIRVGTVNMSLLSKTEKDMRIRQLFEVMNGIDTRYKIFSIARPVDLDGFIEQLKVKQSQEPIGMKKRLLSNAMSHAAIMASGGEAVEQQFYLLLEGDISTNPEYEKNSLIRRTKEIAANLTSAGLGGHLCTNQEIRDLLFIFSNPQQAAYERAPQDNGPYFTNYVEGK
ncbi:MULTISPECIES: hypothetical protein [unclassified Exiguobacterium]|jgi:hypothetical protein|uniref:hypothetical protein n=1 Tax=unclassified Exiguobacterium TaxID=2644629 RepID=UPI000DF8512A|nr:hypothetical protein [Exiguobacterium sp. RIT594]RDB32095.1 hypothetical protein DVG79_15070 [Exiguobacterium sp. RIT594]